MVAGGEQSGYGILTVREQLWMFTQFYGLESREGWRRVDELIEAVGMQDQRLQRVSTLSTGQRQKMNMARGLLNDPWILFLDEPTLGPRRRRRPRDPRPRARLEGGRARAGRSCSRPTTWPRPTSCASGSRSSTTAGSSPSARPTSSRSASRASRSSGSRSTTSTAAPPSLARLPGVVSAALAARVGPGAAAGRGQPRARGGRGARARSSRALGGLGSQILALRKSEPTLEDVFVELVGRGFTRGGASRREPVGAEA